MDFPTLRYLRSVVVQNKRMAKLRKKWLLALRLLLLSFLVLAFAQPYFGQKKAKSAHAALAIYIDNSYSMGYRNSQRSVLDAAKQQAVDFLRRSTWHQVYILSNDHLSPSRQLTLDAAIDYINKLGLSTQAATPQQLAVALEQLEHLRYGEGLRAVFFSDFQQSNYTADKPVALAPNIWLQLVPMVGSTIRPNTYIDTAYLQQAPGPGGTQAELLVAIRQHGQQEVLRTDLSLFVDGQLSTSLLRDLAPSDSLRVDTISIGMAAKGGWRSILLTLQSDFPGFADSFYLTAQPSARLDALVLNAARPNPFLTAALGSLQQLNPIQQPIGNIAEATQSHLYSLSILQGISSMNSDLAQYVKGLLAQGASIAIFFAPEADVASINAGLKQIADIRLLGVDTGIQQAVEIKAGHPLLRDVFAAIPQNVQLPYAAYRYRISAGLAAAGQDAILFRDGSPLLAQYNIGPGRLYLCAVPLSLEASSFVSSYYFAPLLYKMALSNSASTAYAVDIAPSARIFVPNEVYSGQQQVYKWQRAGYEAIPKQLAEGSGTLIYTAHLPQPGFYSLGRADTGAAIVVGANVSRSEADMRVLPSSALQQLYGREQSEVVSIDKLNADGATGAAGWQWWQLALLLATLWLILETYWVNRQKPKAKNEPSMQG